MLANHNIKHQPNQYDKIIKENLEITLPVIIREILGLEVRKSEELPDDVQHTKERKPDALKKITDSAGNTFVLQVEFQRKDEKAMVYRMAEYCIMLMRRYEIPIKQYVIFLNEKDPLIQTYLDTEHLKFDFYPIRIADTNYKLFLKSNNPEVKMLGILANFGKEDNYKAIKSIVNGINNSTQDDLARNKYFNQLRILAQLRLSIEEQILKAMEGISSFFREENDIFYRKGERVGEIKGEIRGEIKGEKKKTKIIVENLILKAGFTDQQIAAIAEADVRYVKRTRARLKKSHQLAPASHF